MTSPAQQWIPAIEWLQAARHEPAEHRLLAEERLAFADLGTAEQSVLHGVLARCAIEGLDAYRAVEHATHAIALDDPSIDEFVRAELYGLLADASTLAGDLEAAHRALSAGAATVGSAATGLLEIQRCHLHYRAGHLDDALAAADRAVGTISPDRPLDRARALNNRGVIRLYVGGAREGLADLEQAEHFFAAAAHPVFAAHAALNKGMMLARLGDLPAALATFDQAERTLVSYDEPLDQHRVSRAEVMVLAGLVEEVIDLLPEAIERLEADGMLADAAEARLYLSMAQLRVGDERTEESARTSATALRAAGRDGWAAIADDVSLQAVADRRGLSEIEPSTARAVAESLELVGMRSFAAASWLRAAAIALAHGDTEAAVRAYERLAARRQTLPDRVVACEAAARRAALLGEAEMARRTAERGLRLIERNRSLFEATELRVQASGWGEGLAGVLVDLAVADGDGLAMLDASERWRSTALATRQPLPPPDDELAELLAGYRAASAAVAQAPSDETDPRASEHRVRLAERAVTETLRRRSSLAADDRRRVTGGRSLDQLGDRALVEFLVHRSELIALVAGNGSVRQVPLGASSVVERAARALLLGLQQLAPTAHLAAGRLVQRGVRQHLARFSALGDRSAASGDRWSSGAGRRSDR